MQKKDIKYVLISGDMIAFDPVTPEDPDIPDFATFAKQGTDLPLGIPIKLFLMEEDGKRRVNQTIMLLREHPRLKGDGVWFIPAGRHDEMHLKKFVDEKSRKASNRIGFVLFTIALLTIFERSSKNLMSQTLGNGPSIFLMASLGLACVYWFNRTVRQSTALNIQESMKLFTDPNGGDTTISAIIAEKGL